MSIPFFIFFCKVWEFSAPLTLHLYIIIVSNYCQ
ncbi:hypothetical protein BE24_0225 [Staphylococcus phage vB_SepM_BE24]|nr:hypothetical protein BE24_0225 [Staphylococcus phage vB_SepM_BE24]